MKSMNSLLAVGLIFGSFAAQAQVKLPKSGLSSAIQQKVAATTLIMEAPDSWCTVAPVTPDGYMLTALHCIRDCLLKNGAAEEGVAGSFGLSDLFLSTRSKSVNVVCNDQSIPALGAKSVKVVATGRALTGFDADFFNDFSPYYQELKTRGWTSRANDFALLKVETTKKLACLPILPHAVKAGTQIWAAGYPMPANENEKTSLHVSPGQVYPNAQASQHYKATESSQRTYIDSLYTDSQILYSNAVSQWGQSGGPIVNAQGALVGVVSGYTITPSQDSEIHELVGASAAWIATQIPFEVVRSSSQCR